MNTYVPYRYCSTCGKPEHGSLACNTVDPEASLQLKPSVVRNLKKTLATPKDKLLTREQMDAKLGLAPLDTLAERVMQKVPCPVVDVRSDSHGNNPGPVHTPSHPCGGTGTILDPRYVALREALWEESELIDIDPGLGFVRRNRAEADGWLMDALDKLGLEAEIQLHPSSCTVSVREEGRIYRSGKPLTDWLDALSAALLAWMDALKKVT